MVVRGVHEPTSAVSTWSSYAPRSTRGRCARRRCVALQMVVCSGRALHLDTRHQIFNLDMLRGTKILLMVGIAGVLLIAAALIYMGSYRTTVLSLHVSGRLVDARTRAPVGNAWVVSASSRQDLEDPTQRDRIWASLQDFYDGHAPRGEDARQQSRVGPLRSGGSVSGQDGRFNFVVSFRFKLRRWSQVWRRSFWPPAGDDLVRVLWIQIEEREPLLLDEFHVEGGNWEKHGMETGEFVRGTLDLGTVEVPSDG